MSQRRQAQEQVARSAWVCERGNYLLPCLAAAPGEWVSSVGSMHEMQIDILHMNEESNG